MSQTNQNKKVNVTYELYHSYKTEAPIYNVGYIPIPATTLQYEFCFFIYFDGVFERPHYISFPINATQGDVLDGVYAKIKSRFGDDTHVVEFNWVNSPGYYIAGEDRKKWLNTIDKEDDITRITYDMIDYEDINDEICMYTFRLCLDNIRLHTSFNVIIQKCWSESTMNRHIESEVEEEIDNLKLLPDTYEIDHKKYREPIFYYLIKMSDHTEDEFISY
jgi:hypothetical protein